MLKRFVAEREELPGAAWLARFNAGRLEAERWYQGEGRASPPIAGPRCAITCRNWCRTTTASARWLATTTWPTAF
jgi:hypothetical protein